jgi:hypothetical protein
MVSYGREATELSLILRVKQKLRMSESTLMRKIFGYKRERESTRGLEKLHDGKNIWIQERESTGGLEKFV